MKARRFSEILFTALIIVTALLLPRTSRAGVTVVTPEMFRPYDSAVSVLITPGNIASGSGSPGQLTAPVTLPVGATIRKMFFYYSSLESTGITTVALVRTKIGTPLDSSNILLVSVVQNTIHFPGQPPLKIENLAPSPAADLIVRKGYRYFLVASCSSLSQTITGVKVRYR